MAPNEEVVKDPEPTPAEKALEAQLNEMSSKMDQYNQVLTNPDVQKVLQMQKDGQKVEVTQPEPPEEQVDILESMLQGMEVPPESEEAPKSPTPQEMLKQADQLVKDRAQSLLKPLQEEINQLRSQRQADQEQSLQQSLASDIQSVSDKYEDFTEFKDGMSQQYSKTPNLTVEQYYILAKHEKLGDEMFRSYPQEESEYPLQVTANRSNARPEEVRHGSEGFRSMLNDAAQKRPYGRGSRY
jgi:hypothetical protein